MVKFIKFIVGCLLMFPHLIIVFFKININSQIENIYEDIKRWKDIKGFSSKSDFYSFVVLLMSYSELRSIFYWRLGRFAKYFFIWFPGRQNLYICSDPHKVGGGFFIGHGWGTVVNAKEIGCNFKCGQNVTIGSKDLKEPIIGNNVSVWTNSIVIGDIKIGDNSQIGAGACVVKNVPENSVVVPSKSIIIKQNGNRVNIPL